MGDLFCYLVGSGSREIIEILEEWRGLQGRFGRWLDLIFLCGCISVRLFVYLNKSYQVVEDSFCGFVFFFVCLCIFFQFFSFLGQ